MQERLDVWPDVVAVAKEEAVDIHLKVQLVNGVTLLVYRGGWAQGSDGKTYYPVVREELRRYSRWEYADARVVGWSCQIEGELMLEG